MKEFPGRIEYIKCGQTRKLVLNDEQKKWLVRHFPSIENCRLAKAMGISLYKLHCFAREMNLTKSEKGLLAIRRRRDVKAAKSNEKNGCYDRKRGRPVSEATNAGRIRRFEEERMGLRENAQKRIRREEPDKYKAWVEKRVQQRRETVRKEKLRMLYGLERKTKLKSVVLSPFKQSQRSHRYNALKRGYILSSESQEGSEDRYVIFYDDKTERNVQFENNCRKDGFEIKEWLW